MALTPQFFSHNLSYFGQLLEGFKQSFNSGLRTWSWDDKR